VGETGIEEEEEDIHPGTLSWPEPCVPERRFLLLDLFLHIPRLEQCPRSVTISTLKCVMQENSKSLDKFLRIKYMHSSFVKVRVLKSVNFV
jgi:hypothetical protein